MPSCNDRQLKHDTEDSNAEFGGTEARRVLERTLLRKIDLRMSIMVVIYILNYVRFCLDSLPKIDVCHVM
jgi:hypothetical protein